MQRGKTALSIAALAVLLTPSAAFTLQSIRMGGVTRETTTGAGRSCRRATLQLLAGFALGGSVGARVSQAQTKSFEEYVQERVDRDKGRESSITFEFDPRQPLGLDLSEVRFSEGEPRVFVKGIQAGSQADALRAQGLEVGQLLVGVNGNMVDGMRPIKAIQAVAIEKKESGEAGCCPLP